MPKERIYTNAGYLEVQWARDGQLVCIVSAQTLTDGSIDEHGNTTTARRVVNETMHQFTDSDDLAGLLPALRRAKRQAFSADRTVKVALDTEAFEAGIHLAFERQAEAYKYAGRSD